MSKMWTNRRVTLGCVSSASMALMLLGTPVAAMAQTDSASAGSANGAEATPEIDIPAQPLGDALRRFAEATGVQLGYSTALVAGKTSSAVQGKATAPQALARLLAGTGITATLSGRNAALHETVAADGERVAGTVRVEAMQGSPYNGGAGQAAGVNGVNGSRDITATEGTKSFTSGALTVGSKSAQSIKDTPQSVSVLTSERMQQQAITTFNDALKQLPGISMLQGDSNLETAFYSRGFAITSIQVDGGSPLSTLGGGYYPQIDLSIYDHIELLRGASVYNGYGDPSGSVNLVRKKPLDHAQYTMEAQAGSWQNYRLVADATSPLALDGKLRGRLVTTYQNRHYFYDTAKDSKLVLYGILELDATPTTLVTLGGDYTRQDSVPWVYGLPRYVNGEPIKLPRSTSFALPWNSWNFRTTELFGSVDQKIAEGWSAKLNFTYNQQTSGRKVGYATGSVTPGTGTGPLLQARYDYYPSKQYSGEATVNGGFELFGQRQEIVFGVSHTSKDLSGLMQFADLISGTSASPYVPYVGGPAYYSGSTNGIRPPINVFNFDPYDPRYSEPATKLPTGRYSKYDTVQDTAYASTRITAFDRLHFDLTLRWTRIKYATVIDGLCTTTTGSCLGKQIGDIYISYPTSRKQNHFAWPPTGSISYDLTSALTAYVGYSDIYRDQSTELDVSGNPLPPYTGSNIEGGLKWAPRGGKVNVTLAAYRVQQQGFGVTEGTAYVVSDSFKTRNTGFEIEASGELLPGWQASAGYTYNKNKFINPPLAANDGRPFLSIQPKNVYKLWTSYDFGAKSGRPDWLSRLTVSAGINGQSAGYQTGTACSTYTTSALGASTCTTANRVAYTFTVAPYAVLAGRLGYRLSDTWDASVNLDNIFDKTYFQSVGNGTTIGTWYGAPRSVLVSLRGKL